MHDIDKLKTWFECYKDAREIFDIVKKNIWNYDETKFWVEVEEKQRVIVTKHANVKLFHEDADNCEHLSSSEFIFRADCTIDSFVIMKRQYHLEKFYFEEEFSSNISVALTDSDYLINEEAISLLEHFDRWISKFTAGRWRLLIWDEYNLHTDYEVRNWC